MTEEFERYIINQPAISKLLKRSNLKTITIKEKPMTTSKVTYQGNLRTTAIHLQSSMLPTEFLPNLTENIDCPTQPDAKFILQFQQHTQKTRIPKQQSVRAFIMVRRSASTHFAMHRRRYFPS